MRAGHSASGALILVALALVSCRKHEATAPPPREPPPLELVVALGRIALRSNAYVELHSWLAAAARGSSTVPEELESAVPPYERALRDDDRDTILDRTTHALGACTTDTCAKEALASTPMADALSKVLPVFVARFWTARAHLTRIAIEATRAALVPETEVVVERVIRDLALHPAEGGTTIDVVAEAPPPGREAIGPLALAAKGSCFFAEKTDARAERNAQILGCALARAAFTAESDLRSKLHGNQGAWKILVAYVVTATVDGMQRGHRSPFRRPTSREATSAYSFLRQAWPPKNDEERGSFPERYLAALAAPPDAGQ